MTRLTRRALSLLTALAMVGTLFVGAPAPVYAADPAVTYYVAQTGEPDGDGSSCADPDFVGGDTAPIASAVDLATNGDTIYICAGTYAIETTILFGGELLTLQGAGRGVTILDGGSTFNAEGANNGDGRQILTSSTALTVSGLTFHGGYSSTQGGAIYATTVTVTNSTFTGNRSGSGGAIYATTVTATTSTFTDNSASLVGGAIYASTATVTNSAFSSNSSTQEGGAILAETGTVASSRFTRNTSGTHGGAIFFYLPAQTDLSLMRRNTFSRNTAAAGGAISLGPCIVPSRSEAARVERANRFSGNRATEQRRTNNIERFDNGGCTGG